MVTSVGNPSGEVATAERSGVPLVELRGIDVVYRTAESCEEILKDLSLKIHSGDSIAILGPSGVGKTTLLKVIAGQQSVSKGEIRYRFDPKTPGHFGYVSQSNSLFPWLTVEENVRFPLSILGRSREAEPLVERVLREVGLEGHAHKYPRKISGGMARRVVLARALVFEPVFLLLDEPFGGLDAGTRAQLIRLLIELRGRHGFTQICVEHDLETAERLSERFWLLSGSGGSLEQIDFRQPGSPSDCSEKMRLLRSSLETALAD